MSQQAGKKIIAVTGATGQQGGAVVKALLQRGASEFSVRALTRNTQSDASKALAALGVEVVEADMDKPETLVAAFTGCHGAFLVTDFFGGCKGSPDKEIAHGKALVDAAKAANVAHVVWSGLEDTRGVTKAAPIIGDMPVPHFDGKHEVTKYAQASGVPLTVLLTSIYFDNVTHGMLNKTPHGLAIANILGDAKVPWIAASDIGQAAAGLFLGGAQWIGKTVGIGAEMLSFADLCAAIGGVIGHQVNYFHMADEAYVKMFSQWMPPVMAQEFANMFGYYRECNAHFNGLRSIEQTKALCGGSVVTAVQWATQNKAALDAIANK